MAWIGVAFASPATELGRSQAMARSSLCFRRSQSGITFSRSSKKAAEIAENDYNLYIPHYVDTFSAARRAGMGSGFVMPGRKTE